jgi:TolA-binding protein
MERGPYDRPPRRPDYPPRDPAYAEPAAPPPEYYEPPRRFGFAEMAAILAVLAAAVAVFLALDARDSATDDEQVARQVRQETQRQILRIRSSLGEKAGNAGARARAAEAEAEQTRATVAKLSDQITRVEGEVKTLRIQQNQVRNTLRNLSESVAKLRVAK